MEWFDGSCFVQAFLHCFSWRLPGKLSDILLQNMGDKRFPRAWCLPVKTSCIARTCASAGYVIRINTELQRGIYWHLLKVTLWDTHCTLAYLFISPVCPTLPSECWRQILSPTTQYHSRVGQQRRSQWRSLTVFQTFPDSCHWFCR